MEMDGDGWMDAIDIKFTPHYSYILYDGLVPFREAKVRADHGSKVSLIHWMGRAEQRSWTSDHGMEVTETGTLHTISLLHERNIQQQIDINWIDEYSSGGPCSLVYGPGTVMNRNYAHFHP